MKAASTRAKAAKRRGASTRFFIRRRGASTSSSAAARCRYRPPTALALGARGGRPGRSKRKPRSAHHLAQRESYDPFASLARGGSHGSSRTSSVRAVPRLPRRRCSTPPAASGVSRARDARRRGVDERLLQGVRGRRCGSVGTKPTMSKAIRRETYSGTTTNDVVGSSPCKTRRSGSMAQLDASLFAASPAAAPSGAPRPRRGRRALEAVAKERAARARRDAQLRARREFSWRTTSSGSSRSHRLAGRTRRAYDLAGYGCAAPGAVPTAGRPAGQVQRVLLCLGAQSRLGGPRLGRDSFVARGAAPVLRETRKAERDLEAKLGRAPSDGVAEVSPPSPTSRACAKSTRWAHRRPCGARWPAPPAWRDGVHEERGRAPPPGSVLVPTHHHKRDRGGGCRLSELR